MSGLVKAKKYDWKDSNLALFGSDTEKQVKKESAQTEPAWTGAGEAVGLQIWRIVKFKVTHWPKEDYGKFYDGDSYIILNTYKEEGNDALLYDVHFWIGADSTQDEYGTAAYKTVELDTLLDDKPVQHREVMNHESDLFKGYFKKLELLKGGADSGFRKVKPEEYKPRLLQVHGDKKCMSIQERPLNMACVTSNDVFILDLGETVYQWNGKESNKNEKFRAAQYMTDLKSDRSGRVTTEILDEEGLEEDHDFYEQLKNHNEDMDGDDEQDAMNGTADEQGFPKLFRVSDASGQIEFSLVAEDSIKRTQLDKNDAFILDNCKEVFVWIGNRASKAEKQNAITHAHNYLCTTNHSLAHISVFKQGCESQAFWNCFH